MKRPALLLVLFAVLTFSLAAWVEPRLSGNEKGRDPDNVFKVFLGEGRRLFANQFAAKADEYFHGGAYPSFFELAARAEDKAKEEEAGHDHVAESHHDHGDEHADEPGHEGHDESNCKKIESIAAEKPLDWIEAMGKNFTVTGHSHLEGDKEREILPWLKLSADLDPQRVESYLVASYYLTEGLNKPADAEAFLRQGLEANPQSYEILLELGKLYLNHLNQPDRARNVWLLGLRRWDEVERGKEESDKVGRSRLLDYLAQLELKQGNTAKALKYLEECRNYSPQPAAIAERIKAIQSKAARPH